MIARSRDRKIPQAVAVVCALSMLRGSRLHGCCRPVQRLVQAENPRQISRAFANRAASQHDGAMDARHEFAGDSTTSTDAPRRAGDRCPHRVNWSGCARYHTGERTAANFRRTAQGPDLGVITVRCAVGRDGKSRPPPCANTPGWSVSGKRHGTARGHLARLGFVADDAQYAAGLMTEPLVCVPSAPATIRPRRPLPIVEDPPGVCATLRIAGLCWHHLPWSRRT
jgi:hypothetical protein